MTSNEQLHDVFAIRAVAERYAAGVDRRDRELFLSAFHSDATLHLFRKGPDGLEVLRTRSGHEEIGDVPSLMTRYEKTFHFIGNHRCEIRGDEAEGEVYCIARHLSRGDQGATDLVMLIRYQDRYRRDAADEWRIADRLVRIDWTEQHETLEVPAL